MNFPKNIAEAGTMINRFEREWEAALKITNKHDRCKQLMRIIKNVKIICSEALEKTKIEQTTKNKKISYLFSSWLVKHGMS